MKEKLSYDSEGMYHDDDIRIEAYGKLADTEPMLVEKVVQQISNELAPSIQKDPKMTVNEIKLMAMYRFLDLINKGLLSPEEANKCYQRFSQMLQYYYGS